jgi:hypothetical protein
MLLIFIAVIAKLSIPFIVRFIQNGNPLGFDASAIIYTILENLLLLTILFPNYLFIFSGLTDFQRRVFMIKACGALITPFKSEYEVPH